MIQVIEGDALEEMGNFPDASFAAVVCDPPYWTLDKWRGIGTTTRLGGGRGGDKDEDRFFPTIDFDYLTQTIREFDRLLPKKGGHAWIMCDGETAPYILNYVRETDETAFSPVRKGYSKLYPLLKKARTGGYRQGMGYHGRCSHEYVILLEKGRRRFTEENWPDVFEFVWDGAEATANYTPSGKPYPTAKPVELYNRLITLSSAAGETVLDPFAGSGAAGMAARETGRHAVLIDKYPKSISTITQRLKGETNAARNNPGLF